MIRKDKISKYIRISLEYTPYRPIHRERYIQLSTVYFIIAFELLKVSRHSLIASRRSFVIFNGILRENKTRQQNVISTCGAENAFKIITAATVQALCNYRPIIFTLKIINPCSTTPIFHQRNHLEKFVYLHFTGPCSPCQGVKNAYGFGCSSK